MWTSWVNLRKQVFSEVIHGDLEATVSWGNESIAHINMGSIRFIRFRTDCCCFRLSVLAALIKLTWHFVFVLQFRAKSQEIASSVIWLFFNITPTFALFFWWPFVLFLWKTQTKTQIRNPGVYQEPKQCAGWAIVKIFSGGRDHMSMTRCPCVSLIVRFSSCICSWLHLPTARYHVQGDHLI